MKNKLLLIYCLVLLVNCAGEPKVNADTRVQYLPYYNEATFTPNWIEPYDPKLEDFHKISPFSLTNQDGEIVTNKTFADKIYITDFFFTSCGGICPKMTTNMGDVQAAFLDNDNVLILSHSVTPEKDSVETLKRYAENKGVVSDKWHLVTGSREEIYDLGRNDYFIEEDLGLEKDADEFLHTENFVLIDGNGHIRGIYNGLNKTSVRQLILDVKSLLGEL